MDATITALSHTTNVWHFSVGIKLADQNKFYDVLAKYATEIGTTVGNWEAFTGTSYGTALTITSVAITSGELVVTFDSTAYTALSSGAKIKFKMKAPTVLDAASIFDIESIPVIITK